MTRFADAGEILEDVEVELYEAEGFEEFVFNPNQPRDDKGRWTSGGGGAPSQAEQEKGQEELEKFVDMLSTINKPHGDVVNTPGTLLKEHGQGFFFDESTYDIKKGPQQLCYMNAGRLALFQGHLYTYVEGYVNVHGVPVRHAWVVEKATGKIKDPTLRSFKGIRGYFGMPFKEDYVRKVAMRSKMWGVLSHTNIPLLEGKDKPKDFVGQVKKYAAPSPIGGGYVPDVDEIEDIADADELLGGAETNEGRWVTIKGRHVFIRRGETAKEAIERSLRRKWVEDGEVPPVVSERPSLRARTLADEGGVWRTIKGRRVFIKHGETPTQAMGRINNAEKPLNDYLEEIYEQTQPHPFDDRQRLLGYVGVELSKFEGKIHISSIISYNEKGKGEGTAAMKKLIALADKHGVALEGVAKAFEAGARNRNGLTTKQLVQWYKKLGFEVSTGNKIVYTPKSLKKLDYDPDGLPLYVRRSVTNADKLIVWAREQGFDTTLPAEDMHVTIAFSKKPVWWPDIPADVLDKVIVGEGERTVVPLGNEGAVVLKFESRVLQQRWKEICDAGASWDFESYQPHVTITYRMPEDMDLSKVVPYKGVIELGREEFEVIEGDWHDKIREQ